MPTKLLTILTVRTDSERLPGKVLAEIKSRGEGSKQTPGKRKQTEPLLVWILRRLAQMDTMLAVATTTAPTDNELVAICEKEGVPVFRGSTEDVISRMQMVVDSPKFAGARLIFRALGDCPFLDTGLVEYASRRLDETSKEAFVYALDSEVWPVYGSREFPYSRDGWDRISARSTQREHPDQFFHLNREKFNILYHLPPENVYFRLSYRLEVDYQADLELVQAVADEVGMLAPLKDIIKYLDANPGVARLNSNGVEKTGPLNLNTYDNAHRRRWLMGLSGKPVMTWEGKWIEPPSPYAVPVFCRCGELLGYGDRTRLHTLKQSGTHSLMLEHGYIKCRACGAIREWKAGFTKVSGTERL